ncbi:hypothetical protein CAL29_28695 [Bordetella genomosp. 10]|uniref:Iron dicitrate transport regulator FecR n=1 Tax=Bordetella genomosp. 10 TaxID=1416804 RepID=A0A261S3B7_9BORD|nr:FecR family protein [Bordetella genomosp. 10]OZI31844.1 hypothetical protein CAL29_28695 [Bordetella genomosp. 10]
MTDPYSDDADKAARAQAIEWFSRMQLRPLTPAERAEYEAWRAASPHNDRHCRVLETIWTAADNVPREKMRAMLGQTEKAVAPVYGRRGFVWGLGTACTAAVVAGIAWTQWHDGPPDFTADLSTAQGERREVRLPDGSVLSLNTATRATVRFYATRREVLLEAGEALFTVYPDKSRPFIVTADQAEVLVTGTVFNVRIDADRVSVAVRSGSVRFSTGHWWNRQTTQLAADQVARLQGARLQPAHQGDVAAATAWQRGRLVFQDTPLVTVVAELNRYLRKPLRIADPRLNSVRVAGTLGIDDPESMLDALPAIAALRIVRDADGGYMIAPR